MLAVFCFIELFSERRLIQNLRKWIKHHLVYLIILGGFFVSCIFEYHGGRANVVDDGSLNLPRSLRQLWAMVKALSKPYIAVLLLLFVTVIVTRRKDEKARNLLLNFIEYEILITGYLLILCGKVLYMSRVEASFGIWFGLVVLEIICIALLAEHVTKAKYRDGLILLIAVLSIVFAILPDGQYQRSLTAILEPAVCEEMDEKLISAIMKADRMGQNTVKVDLNGLAQRKDLLLTDGIGQIVNDTLYYYGITGNHISVIVE